jgi:hypothetical protein
MVVACAVALTAAVPASATPRSPAPLPPVTVDAHGWIHYNRPLAYSLSLKDISVITVAGSKNRHGACTFSQRGTVAAGSAGTYSEQIAVNPTLCQEKVVQGTLTAASLAILAARAPASAKVSAGRTASATKPGEVSATTPAGDTTTHAYEKTSYVDPVDITITSLSLNLGWAHSSSYVASAGYLIVPYEFAYDGWSNSGTPHPGFNFGTAYVWVRANEQFQNNDFEDLLLLLSLDFPGGPALVYAICGFSISTAVFNHSEYLDGLASGGYNWAYNDSTSGGCSDLVSHNHYTGFGSSN